VSFGCGLGIDRLLIIGYRLESQARFKNVTNRQARGAAAVRRRKGISQTFRRITGELTAQAGASKSGRNFRIHDGTEHLPETKTVQSDGLVDEFSGRNQRYLVNGVSNDEHSQGMNIAVGKEEYENDSKWVDTDDE
jgi:type II secretory pathway component HofQ